MPPSKGDPARRLLDDCFLHDRDRLHHQEAVNLLRERILPLTGSQTLPLDRACGHILAEDIAAQRLVPPADDPSMSYLVHTLEGPDDMPAHIKAALLPVSLTIPVIGGRMALGTWQGIYLFEHRDRPHRREVAAVLR